MRLGYPRVELRRLFLGSDLLAGRLHGPDRGIRLTKSIDGRYSVSLPTLARSDEAQVLGG